jgi:hypothetical protein
MSTADLLVMFVSVAVLMGAMWLFGYACGKAPGAPKGKANTGAE